MELIKIDPLNTNWQKAKLFWSGKRGLALGIFLIIGLTFVLLNHEIEGYKIISRYSLIYLGAIVLIFIIWILTTNRLPFKIGDQLQINVNLRCDEDDQLLVKDIFDRIIKNARLELKFLKLKLLPPNFFSNEKESKEWLKTHDDIDAVIFLDIQSGKLNNEKKIQLKEISFTGFYNENFYLFFESVSVKNELSLVVNSKNWEYFDKNSFTDKDKLFQNFQTVLLFYAGIIYCSTKRYEKAIPLFEKIFSQKDRLVKSEIDKLTNKIKLRFQGKNLLAGRLAALLTESYLLVVNKFINRNNFHEAIRILELLKRNLYNNEVADTVYTNLAFCYYKIGQVEIAKTETNNINRFSKDGLNYLLNLGFFAIVNNDPNEFIKVYSKLPFNSAVDKALNQAVFVIAFLDEERKKYKDRDLLFDTAEAVLTKYYLDEGEGNIKLSNILDKIDGDKIYNGIRDLCHLALQKKWLARERYRQGKY